MKRVLIILFLLTVVKFANAHPIHVSVCNIEFNDDKLTIAVKLFKDDFQLAIYHNYGLELKYDDAEFTNSKKVIDKYMNNALKIVLDKKDSLKLSFKRAEINDEAVWFYYTFDQDDFNKIYVKNELLLDIYGDQTNLLILNYRNKQNGYRFNLRNTEQRMKL
jgi:hypothetical protein